MLAHSPVRSRSSLLAALILAIACLGISASQADAYIYFGGVGTGGKSVGKSLSNGKRANQNFIRTGSGVTALAANGKSVYWVNSAGNISSASSTGRAVKKNLITSVNALNITLDSNYIYWVNEQSGVGRANLDGSGSNPNFIPGSSANTVAAGIAVDANYVYWSIDTTANWGNGVIQNQVSVPVATVARANLDGTVPNPNFITGTYGISGLGVNATSVFAAVTQQGGGGSQVGSIGIGGGAATSGFMPTSIANPTQVWGIDLAGGKVFFVDQGYQPAAGSIPPSRIYGLVGSVPAVGGKGKGLVRRLSGNITAVAVG